MNITPTLEELQRFRSSPKGKENEDEEGIDKPEEEAPVPPLTQPRKVQFAKGDTVKVIEGDLKNLMGVVEAIDGDTVTIMPKHEQLHDLLKIPAGQLQKYFKTGDHVKVIAGRHEGETGFIMKIEGTTATLFSDLSNQEVHSIWLISI